MITKPKYFIGVLLLIFLFLYNPNKVFSFYNNEFTGTLLDNNFTYFQNAGSIVQNNGYLNLYSSLPSKSFPFIFSTDDIFPPSGSFSVEIRYQYTFVGKFGTGIAISNRNIPPQSTVPITHLPDYMAVQVWQDSFYGYFIGKNLCNIDGSMCMERQFLIPLFSPLSLDAHILKIIYTDSGSYTVFHDDLVNPIFVSDDSQLPPKYIWFGNPQTTNTLDSWSSLKIDYIKVEAILDNKPHIVLLPGMGGSWNVPKVKYGELGGEWTIPPFVDSYTLLLESLKNAGYVENQDLFIFGYDWRRPLVESADALKDFLTAKGLNNKDVVFVGHSMGGLVARQFAQTNGNNIQKIITLGTPNFGAAEAYGIWEGMMYWKSDWKIKTAIEIASRAKSVKPSIIEFREQVPSLRDILPTQDFLVENGVDKGIDTMLHKNTTLPAINTTASQVDSMLFGINSNTLPTLSKINVGPRTLDDISKGLWEDGRPLTSNQFVFSPGDDTVTEVSAKGPFTNNDNVDSTHYLLPSSHEAIMKIFGLLNLDTDDIAVTPLPVTYPSNRVFVAMIKSPGQLRVCRALTLSCNSAIGIYDEGNKLFIMPGYNGEDLTVEVSGDQDNTGLFVLQVADLESQGKWSETQNELSSSSTYTYFIQNGKFVKESKFYCMNKKWMDNGNTYKNQGECVKYFVKNK